MDLAVLIARLVHERASEVGLDIAGELAVRGAMIHKYIHRTFGMPVESLEIDALEDRLVRMAGRLVRMALKQRKAAGLSTRVQPKPSPRIRPRLSNAVSMGNLFAQLLYSTRLLTPAQGRLLKLEDEKFDPPTICEILGISMNEMEVLRSRAHARLEEGPPVRYCPPY
ncbi:MAG TPA: hypothetical protein VEN81_14755 [Planctomycetota bacterium]|nr:hypothetical protein [Planctomycetota bacterium]